MTKRARSWALRKLAAALAPYMWVEMTKAQRQALARSIEVNISGTAPQFTKTLGSGTTYRY